MNDNLQYTAGVITLSTRAYSGVYEDVSGGVIAGLLEDCGILVKDRFIISDDADMLEGKLLLLSKGETAVNLIITTGGTGLSCSDITPDVCLKLCDRIIPGVAEAMRSASMKHTPNAMLSRAVCVQIANTLVVNFPGSPQACADCFGVIRPVLNHALGLIAGVKMDK